MWLIILKRNGKIAVGEGKLVLLCLTVKYFDTGA